MTGLVDVIQLVIGQFLYSLLGSVFLWVIDVVDNIFRALAGIGDGYQLNGNPAQGNNTFNTDGGLIYDLLRTTVIKKLIIAIMILAAFLLIIFTLMAFLKNVYAQKQKTSKEIISNSIKGALYFIFVPVCTLLGVYVGNIVLKAIDGATSLGGGQQMSSKLFIACAYNANEFRRGNEVSEGHVNSLIKAAERFGYDKDISSITAGMDRDEFADIVDDVFAQSPNPDFHITNVSPFYNTFAMNHILLIVGGVFILYVLCSLAFAMARRIFIILIWFVISPACCAMFPLDEGKMVGKYKDEMTKQVLSAYGAVAGINLFLSIMPLIDNLQIGKGFAGAWGASGFVNLFILISGLLCVKEIVSMLSSMVGGDDALAKGSSLMKQTTGAMKKYGGGLVKKTAGAIGAFRADTKDKKGKELAGAIVKSIGKHQGLGALNMLTKGIAGVDIKETKKAYKDAVKAEKEENKTDAQKKVKDKYLKSIEPDDLNNYTGAEIAGMISKGASHFASADDIYEKLSGGDAQKEMALREKVREFEKEKATRQAAFDNGGAQMHRQLEEDTASMVKANENVDREQANVDHLSEQLLTALTNIVSKMPSTGKKRAADNEVADQLKVIKTQVASGNYEGLEELHKGKGEHSAGVVGQIAGFNEILEQLKTSGTALKASIEAQTQAQEQLRNTTIQISSTFNETGEHVNTLKNATKKSAEEINAASMKLRSETNPYSGGSSKKNV